MTTITVLLLDVIIFICILRTSSTTIQHNIVIIMADDLGWNDVSFHGSNQIPTPNIDALAYNGVVLNRFYSQQACTPSRTALLTGMYPIRTGLQGRPLSNGQNYSLPMRFNTLPQRLQSIGYSTYIVGKWHLGYTYKSTTPRGRGFDQHFGYWGPYVDYFSYLSINSENMTGFDLRDDFETVWQYQGQYATDLFTDKSVEIIRNHDVNKPMFLMVSHLAVHTAPDGEVKVKNVTLCNETYSYIKEEKRRIYAGAVKELDVSTGKIVEALSERGILNNTIILLLSDNGAPTIGEHANEGSNWPLKGIKMGLFEGAVRGTAIVWSSQFKKKMVDNNLFHITDWFPTFYVAAGGDISDLGEIDGINQWDVLTRNQTTQRTSLLVNIDERTELSAFIDGSGRYKLVNGTDPYNLYYGDSGRSSTDPSYNITEVLESYVNKAFRNENWEELTESEILEMRFQLDISWCRNDSEQFNLTCDNFCLFDLFEDPCETTDIKEKYPDILEEMSSKLSEFWEQILPQPFKYIDPDSNPIYYNNTWHTWLEKNCQSPQSVINEYCSVDFNETSSGPSTRFILYSLALSFIIPLLYQTFLKVIFSLLGLL